MNVNTSRLAGLLLLCVASTTLSAQTSREREREREIERRAERLSKNIEKTVEASIDGAMRAVEDALMYAGKHQQGYDSRQSATRIDTTFTFTADGTVDLTSFNGDITVTGWARNQARVRASTERGSLRWRFSSTRISVEADAYR